MNELELRHLDWLAEIMDSRLIIPGTNIPIGLDSIIGLIPGIGDTVTLAVSGYIINKARPHVSPAILSRMIWNVFIDWAIGIVPFFGDIFDVGWRANRKNVDMLKAHVLTNKYAHMDDKGQALFI